MTGIVPKSKAKGTDICAMDNWNFYIIRSDLGCFMHSTNLNKGHELSIWSLHPSCQNGDHYLGDWNGYFYIIKGDKFRRVSNLEKDTDAENHNLHPNCRGGDHYLAITNYFYIIFKERRTYRKTKNLEHDTEAVEYTLQPNFRNGLYYFGVQKYLFFVKPASEWGVEFYTGTSFSKDETVGVYSFHPDVLNFLPGGLSITKGPAFARWENIKTITNDSNTPGTFKRRVNKKVGYHKEKMTQITHNWKIAASVSVETGALTSLIAKVQLSFSAEYGGSHVNTESECWSEMTEEEEELSFELKPNESVYLWQYKLGLGNDPVLFCRDLKMSSDPKPPTEVPLPSAQP